MMRASMGLVTRLGGISLPLPTITERTPAILVRGPCLGYPRPVPPLPITVVFPMFNGEAYVERAGSAARDVLARTPHEFEIVVVDDASTDGTAAIADGLARADPRVRVVHNPVNLKLGGALRAGYAAASKD